MSKKRDPTIEIDQETHKSLKILAATNSVSIKEYLKRLVERKKEQTKK